MGSVWFDGVDDLNRLAVDLGAAGGQAAALARLAVRKTATDIRATAMTFVPVDTGNLRSSITWDAADSDDGAAAEVGPTAAYGAYVEYGTSTQAPQAYMGPAFDQHAGTLQDVLAQIVDRFPSA